MLNNDSIVALATASGAGAIAVIRISGLDAINNMPQMQGMRFLLG